MSNKYLLSYTACAIRRADCVTLAKAFLACGDWTEVRRQAIEEDSLMIKSESARKRISGELIKRLKTLTDEELTALSAVTGSTAQNAICWVAVCRTYEFLGKFITDCVAERWANGVRTLTDGVYESFVSEEATFHPELATVSAGTQNKLRSQLFTMLREMEFVDRAGDMHGYVLPAGCEGVIRSGDLRWFPTMG